MVLCFVEHEGKINPASYEALTLARELAEQTAAPLHALQIGETTPEALDALGAFGVTALHLAQEPRLSAYAPEAYAQCIVEIISDLKPDIVMAAGTERGNEIMAHVGAHTDMAMAANCVAVNARTAARTGEQTSGLLQGENSFVVTRLRWGGSVLEEAKLDDPIKLLTVASNTIAAARATNAQTVRVNVFTPNLSEKDTRVRATFGAPASKGKISLGEARVVVGGGRGVGSAEGFRDLEELAGLLGGAVGASRAVTSLGWRAHSDQIGQTGTRIAPELYIACGVSGAIQHLIGCKGTKHILAINTDPDAPIMQKADYAVIGDLHQVLPAVSAALRQIRK